VPAQVNVLGQGQRERIEGRVKSAGAVPDRPGVAGERGGMHRLFLCLSARLADDR
jgi:hypothetical protein